MAGEFELPDPHNPARAGTGSDNLYLICGDESRQALAPYKGVIMANRYKITCITTIHPHTHAEHITHVGINPLMGTKIPVEQVIHEIDSKQASYYVHTGRYEAEVKTVHPILLSRPYIRTVADQTVKDNLLELPPCP